MSSTSQARTVGGHRIFLLGGLCPKGRGSSGPGTVWCEEAWEAWRWPGPPGTWKRRGRRREERQHQDRGSWPATEGPGVEEVEASEEASRAWGQQLQGPEFQQGEELLLPSQCVAGWGSWL